MRIIDWSSDVCSSELVGLDEMRHYGFMVKGTGFRWETLKENRDRYVHRLNGIYGKLLENNGVTVVQGVKRSNKACTSAFRFTLCVRVCIQIGRGSCRERGGQ